MSQVNSKAPVLYLILSWKSSPNVHIMIYLKSTNDKDFQWN